MNSVLKLLITKNFCYFKRSKVSFLLQFIYYLAILILFSNLSINNYFFYYDEKVYEINISKKDDFANKNRLDNFTNSSVDFFIEDKDILSKFKNFIIDEKISFRYNLLDKLPTYTDNHIISFYYNDKNEISSKIYDYYNNYLGSEWSTLSPYKYESVRSSIVIYDLLSKELFDFSFIPHFIIYIKKLNTIPSIKIAMSLEKENNNQKSVYVEFFTFFLVLGMYMIFTLFIYLFIQEKEKSLDYILFSMSVNKTQYYLSWFLSFFFIIIANTIILTILFKIFVIRNLSIFIVFLTVLLFLLNLVFMALAFGTYCERTEYCIIIKVFYIGIIIFNYVLINEFLPNFIRKLLYMIPQISFIHALRIILNVEMYESKYSWKMLKKPYMELTIYNLWIYSILSNCLFIIITILILIYRDITKKTIAINNNSYNPLETINTNNTLDKNDSFINNSSTINEELSSTIETKECLKIKNIKKKYGEFISVNNVSTIILKNQIFVLLGHNGAGKTTLLSMISGKSKPDSGEIFLDDIDITKNKNYLFNNISICNQEDVFFENLTVLEHLNLFTGLKNGGNNEILINEMGLYNLKEEFPKNLSLGNKRKLSILLALVGNSKIIILDEPTSGIDNETKKFIYKFLKEYKNDKIIILTTHSLEEAEIIADRIAIMREAKIVCCGSPSFLKNHYNCGFNINFLFDSSQLKNDNLDKNGIIDDIKNIDPDFVIKNISQESIVLNFSHINKNTEILMNKIDNNLKDKYKLLNYTITSTSLVDVFLKVNSNEFSKNLFEIENKCDIIEDSPPNSNRLEINNNENTIFFSDLSSYQKIEFQTIRNIKRLNLSLWRNKKMFLLECIACSIIFVMIALFYYFEIILLDVHPLNLKNLINKQKIQIYYHNEISKNAEELKSYFEIWENEIELKKVDVRYSTIKEFNSYISSLVIPKTALYINKLDEDSIEIWNYFSRNSPNIMSANNNLIISSIFKKIYKINNELITSTSTIKYPFMNFYFKESIERIFIFFLITCCINLSGCIIINTVNERVNTIKQLLYMNGISRLSYWIGILIHDLIKYSIFLLFVYPVLLCLDYKFIFVIPFLYLHLITFSLFNYILSFLYNDSFSSKKYHILINYLILTLCIILFSRELKLFNIFPVSSMFMQIFHVWRYLNFHDTDKSIIWDILENFYIFLIHIFIFSLCLYILDKRIFEMCCIASCKRKGDDNITHTSIKDEIETISNKRNEMNIILSNVSKKYCNKLSCNHRVLKNINLGISKNERFGIMGSNGSGKTTLFKCITQEIFINNGTIDNLHLNNSDSFSTDLGYCPQRIALFDELTVEEHLRFFNETTFMKQINIEEILTKFCLIQFRDTISKNLSGGNKRKLSFAIALMNDPNLILLDEPTTGVDYESRRFLWKQLNSISRRKKNFNILLSTHSMEEAETLCDRIGWIKNGNFMCIGNPEKLKLAYTTGYLIQVKFAEYTDQNVKSEDLTTDIIRDNFPYLNQLMNFNVNHYKNENITRNIFYIERLNELLSIFFHDVTYAMLSCSYDNWFEIIINIKQDKQSSVFLNLMNLEKKDNYILEINVKNQSLESILARLEN